MDALNDLKSLLWNKEFTNSFFNLIKELVEIGEYQYQNDMFNQMDNDSLLSYFNGEYHSQSEEFMEIFPSAEFDEYRSFFSGVFDYFLTFLQFSSRLILENNLKTTPELDNLVSNINQKKTAFEIIKVRLMTPNLYEKRRLNIENVDAFLEFQRDPKLYSEKMFVEIIILTLLEGENYYDRNEIIDFVTKDIILETMHKRRNSKAILRQLSLLEWKTYVPVNCLYDEKSMESPSMSTLNAVKRWHEDEYSRILEINGLGGYGKTALMYHYLRLCLRDEDGFSGYDDYFILTGKTESQGEFETEFRERRLGIKIKSAREQKYGIGEFLSELRFESFIRHICEYYDIKTSEENALDCLKNKKVLIVLDNYEDVRLDDRIKYNQFFKKFIHQQRSRIIVTGREREQANGSTVLRIKELNTVSATELLIGRVEHYWREKAKGASTIISQLFEAKNSKQDLISQVVDSIEDDNKYKVDLQRGSRHPLVIFYLASILVDKEALEVAGWNEEQNVRVIIKNIVTHKDLGIENAAQDWNDWVTRKAYTRISNDNNCIQIINFLVSNNGKSTKTEMDRYFTSKGIEGLDNSLVRLENSEVFIEISETDLVSLKPEAKRIIDLDESYDENMAGENSFTDAAVARHELIHTIKDEILNNNFKNLNNYLKETQSSRLKVDFEIDSETLFVLSEILNILGDNSENDMFKVVFDSLVESINAHPMAKDKKYSVKMLNLCLRLLRLVDGENDIRILLQLIYDLENLETSNVDDELLSSVFRKFFHGRMSFDTINKKECLGLCLIIILSDNRGIMGVNINSIFNVLSYLKNTYSESILTLEELNNSNIETNRFSELLDDYSPYLDPWDIDNHTFLTKLGSKPKGEDGNYVPYQIVDMSDLDTVDDLTLFFDINGKKLEKLNLDKSIVSFESKSDITGIRRFRVIESDNIKSSLDVNPRENHVIVQEKTENQTKIKVYENYTQSTTGAVIGSHSKIADFERKEIDKWFTKRGTKSTPGFPIDHELSSRIIIEVFEKYENSFPSRVERKVDHAKITKELMQNQSNLVSDYPKWSEHIKGLAWICGFVGAYYKDLTPQKLLRLVLIDTRKYVKRSNFSGAKSRTYIQYIEEWGQEVREFIDLNYDLNEKEADLNLNTYDQAIEDQWTQALNEVKNRNIEQSVKPVRPVVRKPKIDFTFANNSNYIDIFLNSIIKYLESRGNLNFSNSVKRDWKKKFSFINHHQNLSKLSEKISKHLKNSNLEYVDGVYIHSLLPSFKFKNIVDLAKEIVKIIYIEEEVIEDETELRHKWKD